MPRRLGSIFSILSLLLFITLLICPLIVWRYDDLTFCHERGTRCVLLYVRHSSITVHCLRKDSEKPLDPHPDRNWVPIVFANISKRTCAGITYFNGRQDLLDLRFRRLRRTPAGGLNGSADIAPAGTGMYLNIPLAHLLILSALLPAAHAILIACRRHQRHHRLKHNLCPKCAYDLRASQNRCPECGHPVPAIDSGPQTTNI